MRVAVTGGRHYSDRPRLRAVLDKLHNKAPFLLLIEGGASGADELAREWAQDNGIQVATFRANWTYWGNAAGPTRNQHMISQGLLDMLVVFPGDRGTKNCAHLAKCAGVKVVYEVCV